MNIDELNMSSHANVIEADNIAPMLTQNRCDPGTPKVFR